MGHQHDERDLDPPRILLPKRNTVTEAQQGPFAEPQLMRRKSGPQFERIPAAENLTFLADRNAKSPIFPRFSPQTLFGGSPATTDSSTIRSSCMTVTTVTAAGLGQHLGISRQRVGQLADEGVIGRLCAEKFYLDASRLAYIRWLRTDDRRAAKSGGEDRIRDARASEIELQIAERRRRHIKEANEQAIKVVEVMGPLKSDLYALAARITADLEIRRKLKTLWMLLSMQPLIAHLPFGRPSKTSRKVDRS